jgi:hypothetical protein
MLRCGKNYPVWHFIDVPFQFICKFAKITASGMILQRCTALLLLLAFMAMSFNQAVIVVNFYTNQESIAKTLCENRDKPMMHCCGRCQLRKRLAKQQQEDKDNPQRKADNKNAALFCQEAVSLSAPPAIRFISSAYARLCLRLPVDRASAIFHPPSTRLLVC